MVAAGACETLLCRAPARTREVQPCDERFLCRRHRERAIEPSEHDRVASRALVWHVARSETASRALVSSAGFSAKTRRRVRDVIMDVMAAKSSLACFLYWSKGLSRKGRRQQSTSAPPRTRRRVTCALRWKMRSADLGDDVFVGQMDRCVFTTTQKRYFGLSSRRPSHTTRAPGTMTPTPFSRAAQAALAPVLLQICISGCLAQQQPPSTAGLVSLAALHSALPTTKSRSSSPLPPRVAPSHLPPPTSPPRSGPSTWT